MEGLLREDEPTKEFGGSNHMGSLAGAMAVQHVLRPAHGVIIEPFAVAMPRRPPSGAQEPPKPPNAVESVGLPALSLGPGDGLQLLTLVAQVDKNLAVGATLAERPPVPEDRRAVPCARCVRRLAQASMSSCSGQQNMGNGCAQDSLLLRFSYFSYLPVEIQDMIWDLAASLPKVVHIFVESGRVTRAYIQSDATRACQASRKYHRRQNIHDFSANNGRVKLSVNFDSDFFFIHGLGHCSELAQLRPFCRDLKKVILPCEVPWGIPELLESGGTGSGLQLQELWVLRGKASDMKTFYPAPESQFQRHCSFHQHELLPAAYFPVPWIHDSYRGPWRDERRRFCPACDWNAEFPGISAIALDPMCHHFRVTYDALLPRYPTAAQVRRARNPVLRWVRHGRLAELKDHDQVVSAVACLTATGPATCSH